MAGAFASSVVARGKLTPPTQALLVKFEGFLSLAARHGFRIDGLQFARAFLSETALARMERLVFNEAALTSLREKGGRIEFIIEGPLPPELLRELPLKDEAIFRQVIGYDLCKGCRLCIQVCPKEVYTVDIQGRPDQDRRRAEECTGPKCGKCADVCPEHTIVLQLANPQFESTIFVLLENPLSAAMADVEAGRDFHVVNPLEVGRPLTDPADFLPIFEIGGVERHLADSVDREKDLTTWARENQRDPQLVIRAVKLLEDNLSQVGGLKQGKYSLATLVNRIIDEIIHREIDPKAAGALDLLAEIITDAHVAEMFFGAKRRPIGGLLPAGTSKAWKTPYGNAVPSYARLDKCLGPECGLCVTNCPEGSGGETSAIKMVPRVPLGTIASLVRGLKVFVLKLDGSQEGAEALEELTGQAPFTFAVTTDYCKSCGTCMTCCPHGVIDPVARTFDLKGKLA